MIKPNLGKDTLNGILEIPSRGKNIFSLQIFFNFLNIKQTFTYDDRDYQQSGHIIDAFFLSNNLNIFQISYKIKIIIHLIAVVEAEKNLQCMITTRWSFTGVRFRKKVFH